MTGPVEMCSACGARRLAAAPSCGRCGKPFSSAGPAGSGVRTSVDDRTRRRSVIDSGPPSEPVWAGSAGRPQLEYDPLDPPTVMTARIVPGMIPPAQTMTSKPTAAPVGSSAHSHRAGGRAIPAEVWLVTAAPLVIAALLADPALRHGAVVAWALTYAVLVAAQLVVSVRPPATPSAGVVCSAVLGASVIAAFVIGGLAGGGAVSVASLASLVLGSIALATLWSTASCRAHFGGQA